jgi:curved DNA-binding protein CbpA
MRRDFYAILGVPRNATSEQIRERFLDLVREKHPDRVSTEGKAAAELEFRAITQAFRVLSQPARRRDHDLELVRPEEPTANDPAQLARVYLQRGAKAYKAKNYSQAADNFERAAEADPGNPLAWHHLAKACQSQRRWLPRAAAAIAKACELAPMKPEYHKLAGQILAQMGQKERAARHFRQALQWGGNDSEVEAALEELSGKKRKSLLGGLLGR